MTENSLPELTAKLLGAETNTRPRMSPTSRTVVYVRTVAEGPQLWLRTPDGRSRRLVRHDGGQVGDLRWSADGTVIWYRHSTRGREAWRLAAIRVADLAVLPVPAAGSVNEFWLSPSDPGAVVFASRGALYRASIGGEPEEIAPASGFHRRLVDRELAPRGGIRLRTDGSAQVVLGESVLRTIGVDGVADLSVPGFSADGRELFLLTSDAAPTRRLLALDVETGAQRTVFAHPELDVEGYPIGMDGVSFDPQTGSPDLCMVVGQRLAYFPLGSSHVDTVGRLAPTESETTLIIDRSADDRTWLTVLVHADGPIHYQFLDVENGATEPLFVNRPELLGQDLATLADFEFSASDGQRIGGYVMRPPGTDGPLPTVVIVHGGPAGRDHWRFHADAQYLAALGYQSLHVNYRGSRGFGTAFRLAGNGEWGGRMQTDLYEAVEHGIATGLVDADRVAFFGVSYGGYASLLAACTRPDLVRCVIAVSAPCDLVALAENPPPYWQPLAVLLRRQLLGPNELSADVLAARSPRHVLAPGCAPALLVHGARDPRVAVAEVDEYAARAQALGADLRYLRFADEGHYIASRANREVLFGEIDTFLEAHLDQHDPHQQRGQRQAQRPAALHAQ